MPFNWTEPFGPRQFIDSASPKKLLTPRFQKAVQVIVLCEATAGAIHSEDPTRPSASDVYNFMRVEAAVSYLPGFDRAMLDELIAKHGDEFLEDLRRWTGQQDTAVFFDLAEGRTVTHKLVERLHRLLKRKYWSGKIGEPSFRYNPTRTYEPTRNEDIEVKNEALPPEALGS
jgi:hypothetical protein